MQLSSAARLSRKTSGTHRPITAALLISTQCALCQKSDTVRALWTSSPFKSTQRAFLCCEPRGLCACNGVRLCVLLFVWGSEGFVMDRKESDERNLAHWTCYCTVCRFLIHTNVLQTLWQACCNGRSFGLILSSDTDDDFKVSCLKAQFFQNSTKISTIYHSRVCQWKLWWHFLIHVTVLELDAFDRHLVTADQFEQQC